jgi:hypothetical protein
MIPAQIISDWRIHAPWPDDDDVVHAADFIRKEIASLLPLSKTRVKKHTRK